LRLRYRRCRCDRRLRRTRRSARPAWLGGLGRPWRGSRSSCWAAEEAVRVRRAALVADTRLLVDAVGVAWPEDGPLHAADASVGWRLIGLADAHAAVARTSGAAALVRGKEEGVEALRLRALAAGGAGSAARLRGTHVTRACARRAACVRALQHEGL